MGVKKKHRYHDEKNKWDKTMREYSPIKGQTGQTKWQTDSRDNKISSPVTAAGLFLGFNRLSIVFFIKSIMSFSSGIHLKTKGKYCKRIYSKFKFAHGSFKRIYQCLKLFSPFEVETQKFEHLCLLNVGNIILMICLW